MRQRAETPRGEQSPRACGEGPVTLGQRHGDEGFQPCRLGCHIFYLPCVDSHGFLHQEGIPLIEQVVCNPCHLPVPPERQDEVRTDGRQHLSVVSESRGVAHLCRAFKTTIGGRWRWGYANNRLAAPDFPRRRNGNAFRRSHPFYPVKPVRPVARVPPG